ncbi:peroxisomal 3-ketoacyl-CoA thiolase 3 [Artemisia annua]|uniref:Peroxisomal 3-ketoacyl-CoA thiolase 3 n=1 Tax=Artemisia annua TaxID=35608 RepID=A0A2U1LFT2_ARTAN|nr:peroxisomal 3-ketoacyl-CoA thiolase 3 [Artemisia annua]
MTFGKANNVQSARTKKSLTQLPGDDVSVVKSTNVIREMPHIQELSDNGGGISSDTSVNFRNRYVVRFMNENGSPHYNIDGIADVLFALDRIEQDEELTYEVKTMAQAQDCLLPMGITSENVSQSFGVTRKEQDQAAVDSIGWLLLQLLLIVDPKSGDEKPVTISVDDGVRPGTTLADLAKLKLVFKKDGSTTTGTSSQVSYGAGAVLLMKRSTALQKGLPILGVFRYLHLR